MKQSAEVAEVEVTRRDRRRSHGAGGIREVRPGVFLVDVELPRDPETGKRRRVSRTVEGTREDAELALASLRIAASQRRTPVGPANKRSVRAALDLYLTDAANGKIELAAKTLVTSRSAARTMCRQELSSGSIFGEIRLSRLTWEDIEELYAAMKRDGAGPDWVRRCATVLNRALDYSRKRGLIDANPCRDAVRPRTVRSKPYSPSDKEIEDFLRALRSSGDEEISDVVEVVRGTGMRKGELLGLLVGNLDFNRGEIEVSAAVQDGGPGVGVIRKPTKKSDWRDVPMADPVRRALQRQLDRRTNVTGRVPHKSEFVFARSALGDQPMRPDDLSDRLAHARGNSRITFLDLRHYVATTMLDAGISYRTVADLLGNSEATLRLHYDGRTDTGKRNAIEALATRLG